MSDQESGKEVLFFNYHEFTETYYADLDKPDVCKEHDESEALIITHFPNVYAPRHTALFKETRIVRIPRRFDETIRFPNFSELLPGMEPAAIINSSQPNKFIGEGIYDDGQVFGCTSVSPLSLYLTASEFQDVVHNINILLEMEFRVFNWYNLLDIALGVITLGIWTWLSHSHHTSQLDHYINTVNDSELFQVNRIRVVHPRRSAYLSLDFQIPRLPNPDKVIYV